MVKDAFAEKRIAVEIEIAENLPDIFVDGDRMRQVFLNILRMPARPWRPKAGSRSTPRSWMRTAAARSASAFPITAGGIPRRIGRRYLSRSIRPSLGDSALVWPTPASWSSSTADDPGRPKRGRGTTFEILFHRGGTMKSILIVDDDPLNPENPVIPPHPPRL